MYPTTRSLRSASLAVIYASFVVAQISSSYCDPISGICYQGYTDSANSLTFGLVFPPTSGAPSDEYIVQIAAPLNYGWTALSVGGSMQNSLLFTLWPYGGQLMLGTRWTSTYILPKYYSGPQITLLPDSVVNSTHVKATFRCQNCTTWKGGSIGGGDLNGFQFIAYAFTKNLGPTNPGTVLSDIPMHDSYGYFALNLRNAHDAKYAVYIGGGTSATVSSISSTSSTSMSTSASTSISSSSTSSSSSSSSTSASTSTSSSSSSTVTPPSTSKSASTSTSSTTSSSSTITTIITQPPSTKQPPPPPPPPPPTSSKCETSPTTKQPSPTPFGQCGGICWFGPTKCPSGYSCSSANDWYFQCTPATSSTPSLFAASATAFAITTAPSTASTTNMVMQTAFDQVVL